MLAKIGNYLFIGFLIIFFSWAAFCAILIMETQQVSNFDKEVLLSKLESFGWVEDKDRFYVNPEPDFFKNIPKRFYVYDARNLEMILHPERAEVFEND